jgi:hypothetical protein
VLIYFFCQESGMRWTSVLVPTHEDIRYFASIAQRGWPHGAIRLG